MLYQNATIPSMGWGGMGCLCAPVTILYCLHTFYYLQYLGLNKFSLTKNYLQQSFNLLVALMTYTSRRLSEIFMTTLVWYLEVFLYPMHRCMLSLGETELFYEALLSF